MGVPYLGSACLDRIGKLSRSQREILRQFARGLTGPQVAKKLGYANGHSVGGMAVRIYETIGAENRSEAVAIYLKARDYANENRLESNRYFPPTKEALQDEVY
jgi:DNA-binding CsgD family transcriptional regulator